MDKTPARLPPIATTVTSQVCVRADRDGLARCLALTEATCTKLALGDEDTMALRLAVEEACTNIVDHGYPAGQAGPLSLTFSAPQPGWLEARIDDQATPFHPDNAREPDLLASVEDRPIGGLGWFFIKQVMTQVDYHSDDQGNRLRLLRRLTTPPALGHSD